MKFNRMLKPAEELHVVSDVRKEGRVDGKIDRFTPNHEVVWISVLCALLSNP